MHRQPVTGISGKLPQEAYLWQRQWIEPVRAAIQQADAPDSPLNGLCAAYAEIDPVAGSRPEVRRTVGLDWVFLAQRCRPIGFAVRVRAFPGVVRTDKEPFPTLHGVIAELCAAADAAGVPRKEIQVDFDCPTSRLGGFATWLRALQTAFPKEHFTFTALPSWLSSRGFAPLAAATGGYVLQLHWLRPPGADGHPAQTLCDPVQAEAAVARAAKIGVPFRVALPTYGYRLVLDADGKQLAGAGEGSALEAALPPPGGSVRTLMADPAILARLVRGWQARRPAALQGVIWYRLPVAGERLNWTARTLWAVAAGRVPAGALKLRFETGGDGGSYNLRLYNDGEADAQLPALITVRCAGEPLAADGVGGFVLAETENSLQEIVFTPRIQGEGEATRTLPPETGLVFGWVRLATADRTSSRAPGSLLSGSILFDKP